MARRTNSQKSQKQSFAGKNPAANASMWSINIIEQRAGGISAVVNVDGWLWFSQPFSAATDRSGIGAVRLQTANTNFKHRGFVAEISSYAFLRAFSLVF